MYEIAASDIRVFRRQTASDVRVKLHFGDRLREGLLRVCSLCIFNRLGLKLHLIYEVSASDVRVNPQEASCSRKTGIRTATSLSLDLTTWAVKDDRTSMEHPFFSLSKSHDTAVRHYEHHGKTITIAPSARHADHLGQRHSHLLLLPAYRRHASGPEPKREVASRHIAFWCQPTEAPGNMDMIWLFMP